MNEWMREMGRFSAVGGRNREELAMPSQKLIEASLRGDIDCVAQVLTLNTVDVNYIGTVSLRVKCIETLLREDEADEVEIEFRDFVTDVTPLFAAAHSGHVEIARKLLVSYLFFVLCCSRLILRICFFCFFWLIMAYLFCQVLNFLFGLWKFIQEKQVCVEFIIVDFYLLPLGGFLLLSQEYSCHGLFKLSNLFSLETKYSGLIYFSSIWAAILLISPSMH